MRPEPRSRICGSTALMSSSAPNRPARANARVRAAPMPEEAPVMTAVRGMVPYRSRRHAGAKATVLQVPPLRFEARRENSSSVSSPVSRGLYVVTYAGLGTLRQRKSIGCIKLAHQVA